MREKNKRLIISLIIFALAVVLAVTEYFLIGPTIYIQDIESGGLIREMPTSFAVSMPVAVVFIFCLLFWIGRSRPYKYLWGTLVGLLLSVFMLVMYLPQLK